LDMKIVPVWVVYLVAVVVLIAHDFLIKDYIFGFLAFMAFAGALVMKNTYQLVFMDKTEDDADQ